MTTRFRAASAVPLALVLGAALVASGCGKYSYSNLKALKAFSDANQYYQQNDYKRAAERYEAVVGNQTALDANPKLNAAYFFLGNSYDQMYKPVNAGDPQNDAFLQKAIENYQKAVQHDTDPKMKKLALEYLVAAYGPEKLNDPSQAEPLVQQIIALDPSDPANYFRLSKLYEDAGRYDEAEAALLKAKEVKPDEPTVYTTMANFYNRQGDFDKTIDALQQAASLEPNNPEGYHRIATFYWEKAFRDYRISPADKKDYILKGIAMEDKALGLNPEYGDAMTYKNILLRMQANMEKDKSKQDALLKEADELRRKAQELQKKKQSGSGD
jgi:tetratricopeptide (TPR) repeat protein